MAGFRRGAEGDLVPGVKHCDSGLAPGRHFYLAQIDRAIETRSGAAANRKIPATQAKVCAISNSSSALIGRTPQQRLVCRIQLSARKPSRRYCSNRRRSGARRKALSVSANIVRFWLLGRRKETAAARSANPRLAAQFRGLAVRADRRPSCRARILCLT
jgi:hypothetical protein